MEAKAVKYVQRGNVVYLKPPTKLVWKPLKRAQSWLEGEDTPFAKAVGYGIPALAGLYLVGQVVRWMF